MARPLALLLALPLAASGPAPAASGPARPDAAMAQEAEALLGTPQLSSASKRMQGALDAPADVSVLGREELAALGYRTLGDALGGILGFRTHEDRAYQGLGVRGLYVLGDQDTRVLVLLDGHPLNGPAEVGSSKVGEDFGLPLERVDRVEIIRGPASSLYGSSAFLAVVNVVSRDAADEAPGGEGALAAGSGGLAEAWAHAGGSREAWRWSLTATAHQRRGTALSYPELQPGALPPELDREERQSAYLRLQGHRWSFAGYAMGRSQTLASAPYGAQVGSPGNRYVNRILFGELRLEPELGPWKTLVRLYGDLNEFRDHFSYDGVRTGDLGANEDRDPDRGLGLELQGRVPLGDSFFLTLGTEQSQHRYGGRSTLGGGPPVANEVKYGLGNTYVQGEWTPSPAFSAVLGLHRAAFRVQSAAVDVGGARSSQSEASPNRTSPRVALTWRTSPYDALKLLYGEGFRNPTVFERFYTDHSSVLDNPGLQPERIRTATALWLREAPGGWHAQASASEMRWERLVAAEDLGGVQQFRNAAGDILGRAVEGELGRRGPAWDLKVHAGSYRWSRPDGPLREAAELQAGASLVRRFGAGSAALEARYVGPREGAAPVPGAWTFRASLRWERRRGWLQLSAEDLGNARRRDQVAPEYGPILTMAGPGRSLHGAVGVRF